MSSRNDKTWPPIILAKIILLGALHKGAQKTRLGVGMCIVHAVQCCYITAVVVVGEERAEVNRFLSACVSGLII